MTYRQKLELDHPNEDVKDLICGNCPSCFGYDTEPNEEKNCRSNGGKGCKYCWDREMSEEVENPAFDNKDEDSAWPNISWPSSMPTSEEDKPPRILDSGNRREFETGAVRDICEGKGRCDLLPLDVVAEYYDYCTKGCIERQIFIDIHHFQQNGNWRYLYAVLENCHIFSDVESTLLLEVAKHFEEGCKKYGDNNWQKGIPTHCYIDSAVRHYLKYLRGDKDEPHDRAFCWNILCCIWTCIHKPELNDYVPKEEKDQ